MKLNKQALAIVIVIIIAITVGTVVFLQLTKTSMFNVGPSAAIVEPAPYSYLENSSIFLISATSAYGSYPFTSSSLEPGSTAVIQKGDPCFIINATIRNDYTLENLPPNQEGTTYYANGTTTNTPSAGVYVFLTASIYDKQDRIIQATDVTPPYGPPSGGAFVYLQSGENATLTMYLATSQQDIDHFDLIIRYIGTVPLP